MAMVQGGAEALAMEGDGRRAALGGKAREQRRGTARCSTVTCGAKDGGDVGVRWGSGATQLRCWTRQEEVRGRMRPSGDLAMAAVHVDKIGTRRGEVNASSDLAQGEAGRGPREVEGDDGGTWSGALVMEIRRGRGERFLGGGSGGHGSLTPSATRSSAPERWCGVARARRSGGRRGSRLGEAERRDLLDGLHAPGGVAAAWGGVGSKEELGREARARCLLLAAA